MQTVSSAKMYSVYEEIKFRAIADSTKQYEQASLVSAGRTQCPTLFCGAIRYNRYNAVT
jgi:hypothetical protein